MDLFGSWANVKPEREYVEEIRGRFCSSIRNKCNGIDIIKKQTKLVYVMKSHKIEKTAIQIMKNQRTLKQ